MKTSIVLKSKHKVGNKTVKKVIKVSGNAYESVIKIFDERIALSEVLEHANNKRVIR